MNAARNEVQILEVSPRDGLQAIPDFIPTPDKGQLIADLAAAGLRFIEATSFVSPTAVPQMRDAADVAAALPPDTEARFSALVPNLKGLEAATRAGLGHIGVLAAATETYTLRNTNTTIEGSLERISDILEAAIPAGISARGYVSCAVSCPYEGPVAPEQAAKLAARLLELGCDEVALGDTTGEGTPATVNRLLDRTLEVVPLENLALHPHDTYGQALANAAAALERGITRFDASVAGLGGSPSAPGAGGNLATEDLLYMLEGFGVPTGVDIAQVARIGVEFCAKFGIPHMSRAGRALVGLKGNQ
ncbi:MAG: hydroxymethylglutaryl-CoA lyase [Acidimicrobiia bacterium]